MKRKTYCRAMAALCVPLVLLAALFVFLCVWFFGARYPHFSAVSREEAAIPYLAEGAVPQGLCVLPEGSGYTYAMSAYMADGSASRLCFFGDGEPKYVTVAHRGGPLTTHFGGVACTGNYLVVASGRELVRIPLAQALAAENGAPVAAADSFETPISNAFCTYSDGMLYAGEFYRSGNYETDPSHHIAVGGETNRAFVYAYRVDESREGGIADEVPVCVLSVRAQVQGMAVYEGGILLSTSYGLPDSALWVYDLPFGGDAHGSVEVAGQQVPLYRLDSSNLRTVLAMPSMSEEIEISDGRVHILFESGCNKYKYFVRVRTETVVSVALDDLEA